MVGVFWGGDNEEAVLRFEFIVAFDAACRYDVLCVGCIELDRFGVDGVLAFGVCLRLGGVPGRLDLDVLDRIGNDVVSTRIISCGRLDCFVFVVVVVVGLKRFCRLAARCDRR